MRNALPYLVLACAFGAGACAQVERTAPAIRTNVSGDLRPWHAVTLSFTGPAMSEDATPNPFTDCRMDVTFRQGQISYVVPGYFAADGQAAETSATAGDQWRVHFVPDRPGQWMYEVSFRTGPGVAVSDDARAGQPAEPNGLRDRLVVTAAASDASTDARQKGMLRYVGKRYLQYAGTGELFLKNGADSPENFLGYADFDGTADTKGEAFLHRYEPHVQDWKAGDPAWQRGKGKGIIGALNYLASVGGNSVYFLPYNIDGGDGGDTWPWTDANVRDRFDCSKLDQWEIVFSHMDHLGIALHVVTQETENDQALDGGELGPARKLYYRELIARFSHHLALMWNLGEENTNTDAQRRSFAQYIRMLDPYDHPIVVHTFPGQKEQAYRPLLGFEALEGPSVQIGGVEPTHAETLKWLAASEKTGRPWFVCIDEWGGADAGALPDADDPTRVQPRRALWGNLMAGGSGVEWYFGYRYPHGDLNCEDWRSRAELWRQTRVALEFFRQLPLADMICADELTSARDDFCLTRPAGDVYAVYLPQGGTTSVEVPNGHFVVKWYDPRRGGPLQTGSAAAVDGPGTKPIGQPPREVEQDWAVLLQKVDAAD